MPRRFAFFTFVFVVSLAPLSARAQWQLDGVPLSTAAGNQGSPQIVSLGDGGAIVTWGGEGVYAQRVGAFGLAYWVTDGVVLCSASGYQSYLAAVSDGVGGAIVVWRDYRTGELTTYAQRVDASGIVQWAPDGVAISTFAGSQTTPPIVADGTGGAIVAWDDNRGSQHDIYAQRIDATGTVQWATNGIALCTAPEAQVPTAIVSDGVGGAIVAWSDYRHNWKFPSTYAQRIGASGIVPWTIDGVAVCTEYSYNPQAVTDEASGAIVSWVDARGGPGARMYAQRIDHLGIVQWVTNGVVLCSVSGGSSQNIISDEVGGAIVTWADSRVAYWDIYAQRVDAAGMVQWATDGVAICTSSGEQYAPEIVSDRAGGAFVTWQDYRNGNADIYAQRVDPSGTIGWMADGVAICSASGDQLRPAIESDGDAGAIVTWRDSRNGNDDIYAQRVDGGGDIPTVVGKRSPVAAFTLRGPYPNPFNPTTTIRFALPTRGDVLLAIYDANGRLVRTLVNGVRGDGEHEVTWDGRADDGAAMGSGVYFYRLLAGTRMESGKMVLLK
jgi:hypothetical protein